MQTEVWLTIDEVCSLSGEIKETVRRNVSACNMSQNTKEGVNIKFIIFY